MVSYRLYVAYRNVCLANMVFIKSLYYLPVPDIGGYHKNFRVLTCLETSDLAIVGFLLPTNHWMNLIGHGGSPIIECITLDSISALASDI